MRIDMLSVLDAASSASPAAPAARDVAFDAAYRRFRPLLLTALSRLARQGFVAPPDEGLDLIHDFFLESWGQVAGNHDPSRSKLETYVFAAFVRFARPRIVRLTRSRAGLMAPSELSKVRGPGLAAAQPDATAVDLEKLRAVVMALSAPQRALLMAYLQDEQSSERDLARRFDLNRYQLRMSLADAMGALEVGLDDAQALPGSDREVAISLWRDNRNLKQTANHLDMAVADVQATRERLFRRLSHAVNGDRKMQASHPIAREDAVETDERLLRAVVDHLDGRSPIAETLAGRQDAVMRLLGTPKAEDYLARHSDALDAGRVAELYGWLGQAEASQGLTDDEIDRYVLLAHDNDHQIGCAFVQALLPNLKLEKQRFKDVLRGAPVVDEQEFEVLRTDVSVQAAGAVGLELARFGVTPALVAEAARAIATLAYRYVVDHGVPVGGRIIIDRAERSDGYSLDHVLKRASLVEEVRLWTDLPEPTAARLVDWITYAAEYVEHIFDGFDTQLAGDELKMQRTDISEDDVFRRWNAQPPARQAA